jgi:hypothetical protein
MKKWIGLGVVGATLAGAVAVAELRSRRAVVPSALTKTDPPSLRRMDPA